MSADVRRTIEHEQARLRKQLQPSVGPDVRIQWVKPESIHLTLKFLGDIPEDRVPDIQAALACVADRHVRFAVAAEGLGVFPDVRAPRVLWVGLTNHVDTLKRVAADAEAALSAIGFPPDPKLFHPHLTLARIKERSRDVGRALTADRIVEQAAPIGAVMVNAIALMKSELKPSGAVHTKLCEVSLKEA